MRLSGKFSIGANTVIHLFKSAYQDMYF